MKWIINFEHNKHRVCHRLKKKKLLKNLSITRKHIQQNWFVVSKKKNKRLLWLLTFAFGCRTGFHRLKFLELIAFWSVVRVLSAFDTLCKFGWNKRVHRCEMKFQILKPNRLNDFWLLSTIFMDHIYLERKTKKTYFFQFFFRFEFEVNLLTKLNNLES